MEAEVEVEMAVPCLMYVRHQLLEVACLMPLRHQLLKMKVACLRSLRHQLLEMDVLCLIRPQLLQHRSILQHNPWCQRGARLVTRSPAKRCMWHNPLLRNLAEQALGMYWTVTKLQGR